MRYNEILSEDELFEINMSPTNLQKLVAAIPDARAGLEFEMCVPGAADESDGDQEPDYDYDQRCRSIQDAYDFFYDGDWNSRRSCQSMMESMQSDYLEWLDEKISEEWEKRGEDFLREWVPNNIDESEWNPDDLEGEARTEALEDFIANLHADPGSSDAYDEYREENQESWDESDWLDDADLSHMSEIENAYSMTWPHWTDPDSGGDVDIGQIADSFANTVGRDAVDGGDYHHMSGSNRARVNSDSYIVERDGSLDPEDGDGGLEFVSPPLTIPEMIEDLKNVVKWATKYGCYTGDENKTGLHMNISVPGYSLERLDYLKLAILLGDEHVLNEFGRMGNTYCKSSLGKVKERVRQQPDDAKALLDKMKSHLDAAATKAVHSGVTDKYTSINTKDNRVEFRSPGGDWINEYKRNSGKIVNTILRMVVALDAACDPEKYRQEYQTKLYKLLSANSKGDDTIKYFSEYVAGKIPRAALRSFVKQAQLERKTKRGEYDGKKMWWKVYKNGKNAANGPSVEIVATGEEEAKKKAAQGWGEPLLVNTLARMDAEPLRPYEEKPGSGTYELYNKQTGDAVPDTEFSARNAEDQATRLQDYINHGQHGMNAQDASYAFGVRPVADSGNADQDALPNSLRPTGPGPWEIYNRETGNSVMDLNRTGQITTDRGTAQRYAMNNINPSQYDLYGVRTRGATDTVFNIYADNGRVAGRYETQDEAYEEAQRLANENNIAVHVANSGLRVATATPQSSPGASDVPEVPVDVAQNFPDRTDGRTINFGNQFRTADGNLGWQVYERSSGRVIYEFLRHTQQEAWQTAQEYLQHIGAEDPSLFSCRPKMQD